MNEICNDEVKHALNCVQNKANKRDINSKKDILNNEIENLIKTESDVNRIKVLKYIRGMPDFINDDFELKKWFFNNGALRSVDEVNSYNRKVEDAKYYEEVWKKECKIPLKCKILLVFTIIFPIYSLFSGSAALIVSCLPISFIAAGINLVLITLHDKKTIKNAQSHHIPKSNPRLQKIKTNYDMTIGGSILAALSVGKTAKDSFKEIVNPDSWNCHI